MLILLNKDIKLLLIFNVLSNNSLARHFNHAPQFPFGFQSLQTIIGNSMMTIDIF